MERAFLGMECVMADQWRGKKWYCYGTSMTDNTVRTGQNAGKTPDGQKTVPIEPDSILSTWQSMQAWKSTTLARAEKESYRRSIRKTVSNPGS